MFPDTIAQFDDFNNLLTRYARKVGKCFFIYVEEENKVRPETEPPVESVWL